VVAVVAEEQFTAADVMTDAERISFIASDDDDGQSPTQRAVRPASFPSWPSNFASI
jgi:hypothetical protein